MRIILFENNFKHLCDDVKSDNIRCHKKKNRKRERESERERENICNMSEPAPDSSLSARKGMPGQRVAQLDWVGGGGNVSTLWQRKSSCNRIR